MDEGLTRSEKVIQVSYGVTVTVMMLLAVGYLLGNDSPGAETYGLLWVTGALLVMSVYGFYKDVKAGKKGWMVFEIIFMIFANGLLVRIVNLI